jgi:hypothetical protein
MNPCWHCANPRPCPCFEGTPSDYDADGYPVRSLANFDAIATPPPEPDPEGRIERAGAAWRAWLARAGFVITKGRP